MLICQNSTSFVKNQQGFRMAGIIRRHWIILKMKVFLMKVAYPILLPCQIVMIYVKIPMKELVLLLIIPFQIMKLQLDKT